ncbi:hypothetical protein ACP9M8_08205 [Pseudomonas aeruginosa]|uniref:hypothetical protein n=1 Tax=Pseudomonas aeruginosa TaxID=287 RepID=UPI003CF82B69
MTTSKIQMDQIRSTSATVTGENIRAGSQKKSSLSQAEGLQGASPDATCTCPAGDGSLRHPCPAHPASVELAGVAANLTFINGRPAMCGCQVEYSDGGGEYSDVIYVTLCAKHSGSAILDLVATNRIALTPEYEGQWHADLYLDREIPLAKVEGATPAEAVLALMSAERIDPEQESVEHAGGDERAEFERAFTVQEGVCFDDKRGEYRSMNLREIEVTDAQDLNLRLQGWQARAALAQPSPVRSSLLINGYQLRAALDFIAPDGTAEQLESEACIEWRQQDADFLEAGLYAFCAEYPEEGGVLLDEEPTTAQPSPLQSEQAEAERPEVVGYLATAEHPKHGQPHKAFNYFKDQHDAQVAHWRERGCEVSDDELMTVAQHGRIVGALRAENAKLSEALDECDGDRWKLRSERDAANARLHEVATACATAEQQRDAALAEVERLREENANLILACASLDSEKREMQHKWDAIIAMRDAALARVAELESKLAELEKQEPVALANRGNQGFWVEWTEAAAGLYGSGIKLYAATVAQSQHSVPEGYALIPVRETEAMHDAVMALLYKGVARTDTQKLLDAYIAAAPGKEGV